MGKVYAQKIISLSKYRYLFQRGDRYFLYAPLSNGFAELNAETYLQLEALASGSSVVLGDDVIDMLQRFKVANVDEDYEINRHKFNVLSHRFNPTNLSLTINPTLACNFACPYCFEGTHPSTFMTDEIEDAIVRFVEKHEQARNLNITWFGGEPLLAFDRIVSLTRKLQGIGLNYWAGMITNGYLLTRDKLEQFDKLKIRSVQVTIDGNESMHNSRRFLKNGGDTYERIVT
ncbi:MAG: radical SAM protein, partial [Paramuribaculum sp.]|nr:radical SAM protein [Paramuribaculum sp.]